LRDYTKQLKVIACSFILLRRIFNSVETKHMYRAFKKFRGQVNWYLLLFPLTRGVASSAVKSQTSHVIYSVTSSGVDYFAKYSAFKK
jgi:hypothetical protein